MSQRLRSGAVDMAIIPFMAILFIALAAVPARAFPQSAESLQQDAQDSFDLMDYEMGLRLANRALQKDPKLLALRLRQAEILWKLGRRDVAWMALERMRTDDAVKAAWTGWEAPAMAAFWRWQEGKTGEAEILARDAAYRAVELLRIVFPNSKPLWPVAYAPGLREADLFPEKRLRSLYPPNAGLPAYLLGFITETRDGWREDCERLYLQALRMSYEARDCVLRIAAGRARTGDAKGAEEVLLWACDEAGAHPDFYLMAAAVASAAGNRAQAEEWLASAVELKPIVPGWLRARAIAEIEAGRSKEGMAILKRALAISPDDLRTRALGEDAEKGRSPAPGDFNAELQAAAGALLRGLDPRWTYRPSGKPEEIATAINRRFLALLGEGQTDDAARYLEAYLAIDPNHPSLQYNLAQLHHLAGRTARALPRAWEAAALKPDYRDALDALASLYLETEDFESAILVYADALILSPEDPTSWYNSACARFAAGDRAAAETELLRAVELDRGKVAKPDRRKPAKAGDTTHSVSVEVEPIRYRALVLLGAIRMDRGERERALEVLDEAVRLQPDSPEAYLEVGRVRLALGENEAAKAAFEKYLARGGTPALVEAARKHAARISGSRP
jgi:tetratricopeptide (TPR) repeat protein